MKATSRRAFLETALVLSSVPLLSDQNKKLHLATNQYPWLTFYSREGRNFNSNLDRSLGEIAESGLDGFEPLLSSPQYLDQLLPLLKKHRLEMRSIYVNTVLYDPKRVRSSMENVISIAKKARLAGTKIVVTNPSPIRWGGKEDKNDKQLEIQAEALNDLGRKLRSLGLTLAYHNHDAELRKAAREFHHMLVGTDPRYVSFCLDAHWIFRGAGNSSVALFDIVELYGKRVVELHLRQSKGGIWTEVFGPGDIDYERLVRKLKEKGVRPHLVLEQAVEAGSPKTLTAVEAHRRGASAARRIFSVLF